MREGENESMKERESEEQGAKGWPTTQWGDGWRWVRTKTHAYFHSSRCCARTLTLRIMLILSFSLCALLELRTGETHYHHTSIPSRECVRFQAQERLGRDEKTTLLFYARG